MHKKYSTAFVWGHLFSTCVCYDQFFNPLAPCMHMYAFRVPDFIDLILTSPILTLLFAIVSTCFTSEIQELMFLSQSPTISFRILVKGTLMQI